MRADDEGREFPSGTSECHIQSFIRDPSPLLISIVLEPKNWLPMSSKSRGSVFQVNHLYLHTPLTELSLNLRFQLYAAQCRHQGSHFIGHHLLKKHWSWQTPQRWMPVIQKHFDLWQIKEVWFTAFENGKTWTDSLIFDLQEPTVWYPRDPMVWASKSNFSGILKIPIPYRYRKTARFR